MKNKSLVEGHRDLGVVCYGSAASPVPAGPVSLCRASREVPKSLGISGDLTCLQAKQTPKLPPQKVRPHVSFLFLPPGKLSRGLGNSLETTHPMGEPTLSGTTSESDFTR